MLKDLVVDLSHWSSIVDPEQVKAAGIVGCIYKATEGSSYVDPTYEEAKVGAGDHGFLFGAFHFLRPGDMAAQADHFVRTAGEIDLYAADHEDEGVSLDDLKAFLTRVYNLTGKRAIIYSGHVLKNQMNSNVRDEYLAQHRLWLAQYTHGTPTWPTATWPTYFLWQHTDAGSVPGIEGPVDLNYYDGTPQQLAKEWVGVDEGDEAEAEIVVKVTVPVGVKVVIEEVD